MTTLPPSLKGANEGESVIQFPKAQTPGSCPGFMLKLERETRLELATSTLARLRSTN